MAECRECHTELDAGSNWSFSRAARNRRICRRCHAEWNQRYRDSGYYAISHERRVHRYNQLASERGECADHSANFGEKLLFKPELRAIFQWDHRYGKKEFALVTSAFGRTVQTLRPEIEKCELVCANCHAIATQAAHLSEFKPEWLENRPTGRIDYSAQ